MKADNHDTILIVDDDPTNLGILFEFLDKAGFKVLIATCAESAIQTVRYYMPDMIILDVMMPGMNGFEACSYFKSDELTRDIPIIFMTALSESVDEVKGFKLGAADYITKPFIAETALARIQTHLSMRKLQKRLEEKNALLDQEIAERRRFENELQKREAWFRAVFNNSAMGILLSDHQRRIIQINPAFEKMLGYRIHEIEGIDFIELTHEDDREANIKLYEEIRSGQRSFYQVEKRYLCKNGLPLWVSSVASIIKETDEDPFIILAMIEDITRRKQMQKALEDTRRQAEAANQAKSEFLARMSHEIRTPMNAVIGLAHLALQTEMTERQFDYLSKIKSSAISLLELINDILDFSKIEAGKMDMEYTCFHLYDVLDNLSNLLSIKAAEKNIEIFFSTGKDVPCFLIGDRLRLGQVLINLANNALKFTESGEIVVSAEKVRSTPDKIVLRFSVKDTGIGISKEQMSSLFKPFSQADSSTTRKHGGTGLGLVICKRLVKMMGGEIEVHSRPGRGSTFTFTAEFGKQARSKEKYLLPDSDLRGMRVMVVDDSRTSRKILHEELSAFSFDVTSVASGEEAVKEVENAGSEKPYRLILMDWMMQGLDGIETTACIKNNSRLHVMPVIIMMTAYGKESVMNRAKKAGVDAFLAKPVTPSLMFDTIMKVLKNKESPLSPSEKNSVKNEKIMNITGAKILVVEDNEINQQVARELLESSGMIVTIAENGKQAVLAAGESHFDAILMDIQMPEMDGYEAAKKIRELESAMNREIRIPIIAMTAHALTGEKEKCLSAGMDDHVSKPVDPDQLYSVLARWIDNDMMQEKFNPPESGLNTIFTSQLPGIDIEYGLKRVAGNQILLKKIMKNFYADYRNAADEIRKALDKGDTKHARRMAHTLKGVSGHMGAMSLHKASSELEAGIKTDERDRLLENFETALAEVLHSLASLNDTDSSEIVVTDINEADTDWSVISPMLNKLNLLIDEGDSEALDCIKEIKKNVNENGLRDKILLLEKQICSYDFEDAKQTLNSVNSEQ